jgi:hypothetical protein
LMDMDFAVSWPLVEPNERHMCSLFSSQSSFPNLTLNAGSQHWNGVASGGADVA